MMNYLAFIGPALKVLNTVIGKVGSLAGDLGTKAEVNPKTSLAIAAAVWFGFRPEDVVSTGQAVANFGLFIAKVGQAMGG